MNFFLKYNYLYDPMRYRILEIQLQTFLILQQFCTYLEFRGEKFLNTFIVTNVNDCSNLLSYGATFRMGILLPNYPEENVVKGDKVPNLRKVNEGRTGNSTAHGMLHVHSTVSSIPTQGMVQHMVCCMYTARYLLYQHREWYSKQYTRQYIQHLPDPAGHPEKMKSCTVPVQFQYSAHSARDRNSFQDHHTLCTSNDSKAGRFSTCTCKYFMEWTSSTLYTS